MSMWPQINRKNWKSLTKENKKLFKRIMRDIHDKILNDMATCQRLNDISFAMTEWNFIPFLNGDYVISTKGEKRKY